MLISEWQPGSSSSWERTHGELLAFTRQFGGSRLPAESYRQLMKLSLRDLLRPRSSLLLVHVRTEEGPRLAGFSCITEGGRKNCVVIVHPRYRNQGIGSRLLSRQFAELGELTCRIALTNYPALQMCLHAGLTAATLIRSRYGAAALEFTGRGGDMAARSTTAAASLLPNPGKEGE